MVTHRALEAVTGFVARSHEIDDNYFAHGGGAHGELILWDIYQVSGIRNLILTGKPIANGYYKGTQNTKQKYKTATKEQTRDLKCFMQNKIK